MKKKLVILCALIFIIAIWLFLSKRSSDVLPDSVSVITGSDISNYQGMASFQSPSNMVAFDTQKVPNLALMEFDRGQKLFNARFDDAWAFLDFNYNTELRLINLKKQTVQNFSFPEKPAYVIGWAWIGNQMFIHYYSDASSFEDHYYLFNPDSGNFTAIPVDEATSRYTGHGNGIVNFFKESDSSKNFVINFCEAADSEGIGCIREGFATSNGAEIRYLFHLQGSPFKWGWRDGKFFVSENSKVYVTDFSKIAW